MITGPQTYVSHKAGIKDSAANSSVSTMPPHGGAITVFLQQAVGNHQIETHYYLAIARVGKNCYPFYRVDNE
jgi:hypothetical protein